MKSARTVFTSITLVFTFVVFVISFQMQEYYYISSRTGYVTRVVNIYGPLFRWLALIMLALLLIQLVLGSFRNKGIFLASLIIGVLTLIGTFALLILAFLSIHNLGNKAVNAIVASILCSLMTPFSILSFAFSIPTFVRICRVRRVVTYRSKIKVEEKDEDLEKLSELRDSGAITSEEFERLKNKIVNK